MPYMCRRRVIISVIVIMAKDELSRYFVSLNYPSIHVLNDKVKGWLSVFVHKVTATSVALLHFACQQANLIMIRRQAEMPLLVGCCMIGSGRHS